MDIRDSRVSSEKSSLEMSGSFQSNCYQNCCPIQYVRGPPGPAGPAASIADGFFGVYDPSTPLSVPPNTVTAIPITLQSLVDPTNPFVATANTFITLSGNLVLSRVDPTIPVKYRVILSDNSPSPCPNNSNCYELEFDYYFGPEPNSNYNNDLLPINALIEPTSNTGFALMIQVIAPPSSTANTNVVSSVLGGFVLPVAQNLVDNANIIFGG